MLQSLEILIRPLVRLLLRKGVTFPELVVILKRQYVSLARSEFTIQGRKQSNSRVALLTGLSRHDVARIDRAVASDASELDALCNRNMQLIHGWLHDEQFRNSDGKPARLHYASEQQPSFEELVKQYGSDIPARAWFDELTKQQMVVLDSNDKLKLLSPGYVPTAGEQALIHHGFTTVADLLATIDHNDQHDVDESRLQLSVAYDSVDQQGVEAFRFLSREKSKALLVSLDKFLKAHDSSSDSSPVVVDAEGGNRMRTGLSIFYFEERT